MGCVNWSAWSMISAFVLLILLTHSCEALLCHTCDVEDCKNFNKKNPPTNCTIDDLALNAQSASLLRNLTYIPFAPIHKTAPAAFVCQKIDANTTSGEMLTLRRCAPLLNGDELCEQFRANHKKSGEKDYPGVNCTVCDTDGCNHSSFSFIWIPLLVPSIILCLVME